MQIALDFPDTLPIAQFTTLYLQQALITNLYHVGQLSSHQACTILGLSRRQFEALLSEFNLSILRDDINTIHTELNV